MIPSLYSFDPRKRIQDKQGVKIVLTASATEMSDFYNNQFFAFVGGFKGSNTIMASKEATMSTRRK
jgi:hypothetical protein